MPKPDSQFTEGMSWEEKAPTNPLYAVMSAEKFSGSGGDPSSWSEEDLATFFKKGESLYEDTIRPELSRLDLRPDDPDTRPRAPRGRQAQEAPDHLQLAGMALGSEGRLAGGFPQARSTSQRSITTASTQPSARCSRASRGAPTIAWPWRLNDVLTSTPIPVRALNAFNSR